MKRNEKQLVHARTCVYNMNYHIIWGTKYRNGVLSGSVEDDLKNILLAVASENGFRIGHMEVGLDDHVHLLVSAPPKLSVTVMVKEMKGTSAFRLFRLHPELKKTYWKTSDRHLWSRSYYCETIGSTNEQAVAKYIDDQRLHEKSFSQ
jgi:putative transposase